MSAPYFGYGSNLDAADVIRFAKERGEHFAESDFRGERAWLPDHRPIFHYHSNSRGGGALDVTPAKGSIAPGALLRASDRAWSLLDVKEGAGARYVQTPVVVCRQGGELQRATTYTVLPEWRRDEHVPPTPAYLMALRRGYSAYAHDDVFAHVHDPTSFERAFQLPRLFVYGSLMSDQDNHHRLPSLRHEAATLHGAELHHLGAYPAVALRASRPNDIVHGELHTLDASRLPELFTALDHYEDFAGFSDLLRDQPRSLYQRTLVEVRTARMHFAWTYVLRAPHDAPLVESGNWRER